MIAVSFAFQSPTPPFYGALRAVLAREHRHPDNHEGGQEETEEVTGGEDFRVP